MKHDRNRESNVWSGFYLGLIKGQAYLKSILQSISIFNMISYYPYDGNVVMIMVERRQNIMSSQTDLNSSKHVCKALLKHGDQFQIALYILFYRLTTPPLCFTIRNYVQRPFTFCFYQLIIKNKETNTASIFAGWKQTLFLTLTKECAFNGKVSIYHGL